MRRSDVPELLTLTALWGGSFLFMHAVAPPFGSVALTALRVVIASCFPVPTLALRGGVDALHMHQPYLLVMSVLNLAVPFCLFAYAELTFTTGFTSALDAAAPLFTAIVAFTRLDERIPPLRMLGLTIGFVDVIVLVGGSSVIDTKQDGVTVATALSATASYGVMNSYTECFLADIPPLVVVADSQVVTAIVLTPLVYWLWPAQTPTDGAWPYVITLSITYMDVAYILLFRLATYVDPARMVSITFLIPVFGALWDILLLSEQLTLSMIIGYAVILLGTSLSTSVSISGKKAATNGTTPASGRDSLLHSGR